MEMTSDTNMIGMKVDGTLYALTVQDFGTHWKIRVYQDDRVIGFRDYPFATEITNGVMKFAIRSVVREKHGQAKKA